MSREDAILEKLERELNLKQLQIKSLLAITQAINDNVNAAGLYNMYKSFMSWEMGASTMALFVKDDEKEWPCVSHHNVDIPVLNGQVDKLLTYNRMHTIKQDVDPPVFHAFDIIIPVYHKDNPIAYALIGGIREKEDIYNKIQFITTITNIIAVAIENKRLFKRQIAQERVRRDMELASSVQKMLIPDQFPRGEGYELDAIYKPHYNVGGDYFDFIQYDRDRFAFCIADISGKGVAAAILMANFQAILQSLIYQYRDLETFIVALNQSVYRITKSDKFITLFVAELDLRSRSMRYINAGHFPPYLLMNGELQRLEHGCTVIGSFEQLPFINMGEVPLEQEGLILSFTDGLTDLQNENGVYFDEPYIEQFIREHPGLSATDFNAELLRELEEFKGDSEFPDDIAIVTCKFFP